MVTTAISSAKVALVDCCEVGSSAVMLFDYIRRKVASKLLFSVIS
jgi:hypothetical protein